MSYPILVKRYDAKHPSDLAICKRCGREAPWDVTAGDPEDLCARCPATDESRPGRVCAGQITMKYLEGESCRNCGKLDHSMPRGLAGCCSRVCMLQAEYAATLRGA